MLGLVLPLLVMSIVGALWARSLSGLQRARVHCWPLAVGSIAVQVLLFNPAVDRQPLALALGPWIYVLSLLGMLAVLIRNGLLSQPTRIAWGLAALGVAANVFVILANGGHMPQSPEARMAARGIPLVDESGPPQLHNVAPSGPQTRFAFLGDVIAEPDWLPTTNVVSVGDLLLSLGMAGWAFQVLASQPLSLRGSSERAAQKG
jgi:Family of unknown function (DUF5317)